MRWGEKVGVALRGQNDSGAADNAIGGADLPAVPMALQMCDSRSGVDAGTGSDCSTGQTTGKTKRIDVPASGVLPASKPVA